MLEAAEDAPAFSFSFRRACSSSGWTPGRGYSWSDLVKNLTARANWFLRRASAPMSRQRAASSLFTFVGWTAMELSDMGDDEKERDDQ
jgi:hypothetical protein